jgi:hypothetical protein
LVLWAVVPNRKVVDVLPLVTNLEVVVSTISYTNQSRKCRDSASLVTIHVLDVSACAEYAFLTSDGIDANTG